MNEYNHKKVDKKWQDYWEENKSFQAVDFRKKKNSIVLLNFPIRQVMVSMLGIPDPTPLLISLHEKREWRATMFCIQLDLTALGFRLKIMP